MDGGTEPKLCDIRHHHYAESSPDDRYRLCGSVVVKENHTHSLEDAADILGISIMEAGGLERSAKEKLRLAFASEDFADLILETTPEGTGVIFNEFLRATEDCE